MEREKIFSLILRYVILILLGLFNLSIFYFIFTPLTVYPVFWFLDSVYGASLLYGNVIFFEKYFASIIPACIAGAAYYLLLILNLTTPMKTKTRIRSIIFLIASFLVLNIIRIIIFAVLITKGYQYFDLTHTATWYFGSTVLVILIWFSSVMIFSIKTIPVYTDIKSLVEKIKVNK